MLELFRRILKDKRDSLFVYLVASFVFVEMYLALFPTLKDQADELNKLLEAYPKGFMSAFGFEGTATFFSRVENYMATEFFTVFWPILTVIMLVSFASAAITNEIEKGTIELTLAQPVSRIKVFFSRYLAGLVYFAVYSSFSIFSIVIFSTLHGFEIKIENFVSIWFVGFLFGAAVFSLANFFSVLFSEKGKAVFATTGVILLMYFFNILAGLEESLSGLKNYSFFHYMNANQVLGKNIIVEGTFPVFLGTIIIATLTAAYIFNKRDITT